jgi:hypothetical protein
MATPDETQGRLLSMLHASRNNLRVPVEEARGVNKEAFERRAIF